MLKPGYKTTEFWKSALLTTIPVIAFAAKAFGYDVAPETINAALVFLVAPVAYIFQRGWVKRSA